jgi:hypothetical protein
VVPSCLKDADGARTHSDQKEKKSMIIVVPSSDRLNNKNYGIHILNFLPRLGAHGISNLSTSRKTE